MRETGTGVASLADVNGRRTILGAERDRMVGWVVDSRRSLFAVHRAVTIKRIVRRFQRYSKLGNLAHAILRSVLSRTVFSMSRDWNRVAISRERFFPSDRTKRRLTRQGYDPKVFRKNFVRRDGEGISVDTANSVTENTERFDEPLSYAITDQERYGGNVYVHSADMNGLGTRASVRICRFGHDDFQYKLKLLEGVSSAVGECQGAKDREREASCTGNTGQRRKEAAKERGESERASEGSTDWQRKRDRRINEGYKATKLGQFRLVRGRLRFRLDR